MTYHALSEHHGALGKILVGISEQFRFLCQVHVDGHALQREQKGRMHQQAVVFLPLSCKILD
jgi:hypothetical protein